MSSKTSFWRPLAVSAALVAFVLGCSSSSKKTTDDDTTTDDNNTDVQVESLEKCTDCFDYVVDRVIVPTSFDMLGDLSRDIDGDGKIDNAVGKLLAQVLQYYNVYDVQGKLDQSVNKGQALAVLRLKSDSGALTDGVKVKGQLLLADDEDCCESGGDQQCAVQSRETCFSGSYTFQPQTIETTALAAGEIADGRLTLAGTTVEFRLALFGEPTTIRIREPVFEGTLDGDDKIVEGKISGVVDQNEVSKTLVLGLVNVLNQMIADSDSDDTVKQALLVVFDIDKDGSITIGEVTNGLLKDVFAGDLDIDNDGTKELSVGFGFTAVSAEINY